MLVNPGKLSLDFMSTAPVGHSLPESSKRALGVLTVTVQGSTPPKKGQHTGEWNMTVKFLEEVLHVQNTYCMPD